MCTDGGAGAGGAWKRTQFATNHRQEPGALKVPPLILLSSCEYHYSPKHLAALEPEYPSSVVPGHQSAGLLVLVDGDRSASRDVCEVSPTLQ